MANLLASHTNLTPGYGFLVSKETVVLRRWVLSNELIKVE